MKRKMSIDVQHIRKKYPNVDEVHMVVGVWQILIKDCPSDLKIKVIKNLHGLQSPYMGVTNYEIKNPKQISPYRSLCYCNTVQEALEDALMFLNYLEPDLVDETEFIPVKDW